MKKLMVLLGCMAVLGSELTFAQETSFGNARGVVCDSIEVPVCNSTNEEVAMDAFVEQRSKNGQWTKDYNFNIVKSRVYLAPNGSMTVTVSPVQSLNPNSEYRLVTLSSNELGKTVKNYQVLNLASDTPAE